MTRTHILLKLTGEFVGYPDAQQRIRSLAQQIMDLRDTHTFSIVIGGGNLFRGSQHGKALGLEPVVSHQMGMLATCMNGLAIQNLFKQEGLPSVLLTALDCPSVGSIISPQTLNEARDTNTTILFVGGTGAPFLTTDTAAVIRALQCGADELWKATKVDGVYTADPLRDPQAQRIARISCAEAIEKNLMIMDKTALVLAHEQHMPLRVFSLLAENSLIQAARDEHFGSVIYP